jgi:cell division protein FtsL
MNALISLYGRLLTNSFVQILLVVLLVATGAYLYVPLHEGRQLKERLTRARAERVELEACYPIYLELARLELPEKWPELALPQAEKLTERDIASVTERFMQVATNSLVELGAVSPRVQLDESDRRYLAVTCAPPVPTGNCGHSCWGSRRCRRWSASRNWKSGGRRCRSSSTSRCGWRWNRERP